MLLQCLRAINVVSQIFRVAIAIYFNNPMKLRTIEIDDESIYWFLPQKFVGCELVMSQNLEPDFLFGRGWVFTIGTS